MREKVTFANRIDNALYHARNKSPRKESLMRNKIVSIIPPATQNDITRFRKEPHFYKSIVMIDLDTGNTIADVRFYQSERGNTNYCVLWLTKSDEVGAIRLSGGGKAGGYGYHRESASMQFALAAAGVKLEEAIDGRGEGVMRDALIALYTHWGYTRVKLFSAHG